MATTNNRKRKLEETDDGPSSKRMKLSYLSTQQVIDALHDIFIAIKQPCDLTVGGRVKALPLNPGLHIDGIGEVPLPISEAQLPLLLSTASKSSFGNGTKTEKNEEIRKSLELTSNDFCFLNPEWNEEIAILIRSVAMKLGCDDDHIDYVRGHCYKLLIYEKDGHFAEHRDTQKMDGMFATLVVQLPSKYTMVDHKPVLTVKHRDNIHNYYFGANDADSKRDSRYNIYYSAHYVDLLHKINKIQDGIRMVITYNLCWNGPQNIMPQISMIKYNVPQKITDDIDHVLQRWKPSHPHPIAIHLNHLYTDKELSKNGINALKGGDFATIHSLMRSKTAQEMDLQIFVAEVHRSDYTAYALEPGAHDEHSRTTTVHKKWYSKNGNKFYFGSGINVNLEKHCIGYDEMEDDDDWDFREQRHGTLGNEGASQTTIYSKYIAIFFKKENQFEFLLNGGIKGAIEWVTYLLTLDKNRDVSLEMEMIVATFNGDVRRYYPTGDRQQVIPILSILLQINHFDLMATFINEGLIPHDIGLHSHDLELDKTITDVIVKYGWNEPIKSSVLNLIDCMTNYRCDCNKIRYYIGLLIDINNSSHYKYEEIFESIAGSSLAKALNVSHVICKEIAEYASDNCLQEISAKLWQNIVGKLHLDHSRGIEPLDIDNIVSILQLILLCDSDKQQQESMFGVFFKAAYTNNVFFKTSCVEWSTIITYIKGIPCTTQHIDILMHLFKPHDVSSGRYIPSIFDILMKEGNFGLIKGFIENNLIPNNAGLHVFNYNQNILDFIVEFGWNDAMKSVISKLLKCILNPHFQLSIFSLNNYYSLPKLIEYYTWGYDDVDVDVDDDDDDVDVDDADDDDVDADDDDDIVILSENHKLMNGELDVCWKEIANQIWEHIMEKLELNEDGKIMKSLSATSIIGVLEFMIFCDGIWKDEYKQKIYNIFDTMYGNNVDRKIQNLTDIQNLKDLKEAERYRSKDLKEIMNWTNN